MVPVPSSENFSLAPALVVSAFRSLNFVGKLERSPKPYFTFFHKILLRIADYFWDVVRC